MVNAGRRIFELVLNILGLYEPGPGDKPIEEIKCEIRIFARGTLHLTPPFLQNVKSYCCQKCKAMCRLFVLVAS